MNVSGGVCERVNFVLDRCEDTAMVYMHLWPDVESTYMMGLAIKKLVMMKVVNACLASKFIQMNNKKRRKKQGSS